MASVDLTTLRARVREMADMVGSTFVTDGANSVDAWINEGLDEVYDELIALYGEDYFVTLSTFTTSNGVETVTLSPVPYKLLGVDLSFNGEWVTLERFNFAERNAYRASVNNGELPRYRLENSATLRLLPAPQAAYSGRYWHVPQRTKLSAGSDAVDFPGNWEAYAVLCAAIKCLAKEESDIGSLMALKQQEYARLKKSVPRDAGEPEQMVDTDSPYRGSHRSFEWL